MVIEDVDNVNNGAEIDIILRADLDDLFPVSGIQADPLRDGLKALIDQLFRYLDDIVVTDLSACCLQFFFILTLSILTPNSDKTVTLAR